jgi:hypothetical protein
MKLTHVGSLPFLDINKALDYTFLWDIPVLPSLPILDKNQFLGEDIKTLLDLNRLGLNSKKELEPFYFEPFIKELKARSMTRFKYQLIGPVTFYEMNKDKFEFNELVDFFEIKYSCLLKNLQGYGELLFVLDEPLLDKNYDFYRSERGNSFIKKLETSAEIFIHSCAQLELEKTQGYTHYLNIDLSLYDRNEKKLEEIQFPGSSKLGHAKYLSPSCGLALKTEKQCFEILSRLKH